MVCCNSLFAQASTDHSTSAGIDFMVPREPGRADGSTLLPRSTDFKDGPRDGAREDARDRGTDGAREGARERGTEGAREDAREGTPGFTEPLRETALEASAITGSVKSFYVMVTSITASVVCNTGGARDCWRDATS